jgi:hypothetical protein
MSRLVITLFLAVFCSSLLAGEPKGNPPVKKDVPQTNATRVALHLEPGAPIREKVRILQDFLGEHYFDENGIMYALWYWKGNELRPFREDDLVGASRIKTAAGFSMSARQNHENSAWTSGLFLQSQSLRFRATGDQQALRYAAKAFHSIDQIFKLAEAEGQKGFLCKPYYGRLSKETSVDQYCAVMMGLWEYRDIAPKEARQRIGQLLPAMADWWRERKYVIRFFDAPTSGSDADPIHNPPLTALNQMAYLITGDPKYQKEALRLIGLLGDLSTYYDRARQQMLQAGTTGLSTYYEKHLYDPARRDRIILDGESRGAVWMSACAYPFLFRHDFSRANLFKHGLYRAWKHMQYGLSDDLLSYYRIQVDLERDLWRTVKVPPTPQSVANAPFGWHFLSYTSEVCWGDAVSRIPHVSLMAHKYAGEFCPGALPLAKKILRALDDRRLHWFIDPDGKQLLPPDAWMGHVLSSDVPVFTLLAYWFALANKIPLE